MFTVVFLMFLLTIGILSLLIVYTPFRNILPGYSASLRQEIIEESMRIDSLQHTIDLQTQYISVVRDVMAGEVKSDTVVSLDSLQIIMQEQLLEAKNAATEEFVAQYEEKESERFQLFDIQSAAPVYTLFRPLEGIVIEHYNAEQNHPYITLRTALDAPLTAVLSGVVVFTNYDLDNTYSIIVQHDAYLTVYRHASALLKQVGDVIQAGGTLGMATSANDIAFYLWHDGQCINPEELIAF